MWPGDGLVAAGDVVNAHNLLCEVCEQKFGRHGNYAALVLHRGSRFPETAVASLLASGKIATVQGDRIRSCKTLSDVTPVAFGIDNARNPEGNFPRRPARSKTPGEAFGRRSRRHRWSPLPHGGHLFSMANSGWTSSFLPLWAATMRIITGGVQREGFAFSFTYPATVRRAISIRCSSPCEPLPCSTDAGWSSVSEEELTERAAFAHYPCWRTGGWILPLMAPLRKQTREATIACMHHVAKFHPQSWGV